MTDAESRLMNVLWKKGQSTVGEVVAALPRRQTVAYNTVQTMLRILEAKGYVAHEQVGRAFVYRPLIEQRTARRRALGHLIKALFDNSPSQLVLDVLDDARIDPEEIDRLKRVIAEA